VTARAPGDTLRPADLCAELLAALDASDGRRRRRKRDTTPDAIGLGIKRTLLERAAADDPAPAEFEGWLLAQCLAATDTGIGAVRAMAIEILAEWRLAAASPTFKTWLDRGGIDMDVNDMGGPDMARSLDIGGPDTARSLHMGGPDTAPQPRSLHMGGPDMAPQTPQRSEAPRRSRGAPR